MSKRGPAFPTTRWSQLATGDDAGPDAGRRAFECLARLYFRPIVAYIRTRWARTDEDARDAAQEFFLWMLEGGFLARADPERGRFRGFIKTSLDNFLTDLERGSRALKRGGGRRVLDLDFTGESEPFEPPDPVGRAPEDVLDDLWRKELLAHATDELENDLGARGKDVIFQVFHDYFLSDEELDYASVARRYGITTVDVSNHLAYAKNRYRALLRAAVLDTVRSDEDLRAELAWLFERSGG